MSIKNKSNNLAISPIPRQGLKRLHRLSKKDSHYHFDHDGILYNTNKVLPFTHISQSKEEEYIRLLQRDLIEGVPTFLFLGSGTQKNERFQHLNAATNYILVDYEHKAYTCISNSDKRIISLDLDVIVAIRILNKLFNKTNQTIDFVCSQNEGLDTGGGNYVLNSNLLMGLLLPILNKDKTILISSKSYYKKNGMYNIVKTYNKLPFENSTILKRQEELKNVGINQNDSFFTTYHHSSSVLDYTLFENKITNKVHTFESNKVKINLIQGSIFDNKELDAYFIITENTFVERLIRNGDNRVFDKRGVYTYQNEKYDLNNPAHIIDMANKYNLKHIGFIPFGCQDYKIFLDDLTGCESCIAQISLYHFHKGDFQELYKL